MTILENDMEDLIAQDPQTYLKEPDLKLICRQYRIGSYRFDLLFEDRHGAKLIVEIQRGTLDRNHTYKILDYYDEYKDNNPHEFVELMVVANHISRERRERLQSKGISFREIPMALFSPKSKDSDGEICRTTDVHKDISGIMLSDNSEYQQRFLRLLERDDWKNKPNGLTEHRKVQLQNILNTYDGKIIPFAHFSQERINNSQRRNSEIYPIVIAYYANHLIVNDVGLEIIENEQNLQILNCPGGLSIVNKVIATLGEQETDVFSRSQIIEFVLKKFPGTNPRSIIPSDYCYNLVNEGIDFKKNHLFEYLGSGKYQYFGENYNYTGKIFRSKHDEPVGEWLNGILTSIPREKSFIIHPLKDLIQSQQPAAQYLPYLDNSKKIDFLENLHSLLIQESPEIVRIFNKKEITYSLGVKFACIVPQRGKIVVGPLLVRFDELDDPNSLCRDIRDRRYSSGGEVRADFNWPYSDMEYAVFLIKQSLVKISGGRR